MADEPPTPPKELPADAVDALDECELEVLRQVARHAGEFAEYREREARVAERGDEAEIEDRPEDIPDDVPSKATITIKEINDNRYYYWQWRDGDTIRSRYEGPIAPAE